MPQIKPSPFYRFQGWRFVALFIVYALYTIWFVGPGYFGQLSSLENYTLLQKRVFYSGSEALAALNTLEEDAFRVKFLALIFDFPYMILQALVFEAAIAFGILQMRLKSRLWQALFLLPIGFLLFDVFEDSALLLLMTTRLAIFGSISGVMTFFKFIFFIPACFISLAMMGGGAVAIARRRIKP